MARLQVQRTAYLIAALATLVGAGGGIAGLAGLIDAIAPSEQRYRAFVVIPMAIAGVFVLLLAGAFLYLAHTPRGWGKILCVVGLPWIWFSTILSFMSRQGGVTFTYNPLLLLPGIAGVTLIAIGIVLLVQDRGRVISSPNE